MGYQPYFNQVSLRCRHSGLTLQVRPEENKKKRKEKRGATACSKIVEFG
jgi:hypothetical protein